MFGAGLERSSAERIPTWSSASRRSSHQAELDLLRRCQEMGVTVSVLPRLFEGRHRSDRPRADRRDPADLGPTRPTRRLAVRDQVRRRPRSRGAGDRLPSPILAPPALATLINVTLGRPVIFRQRRVGLDGREFDLFKFRTMRPPSPGRGQRGGARRPFHQGSPRRRRGARPAHPRRPLPAEELDRRAPAALQRAPGRHVAGRAAARSVRATRACSTSPSTATPTGTGSSPGSPAGRRSRACAATRRSRTGSSGTTTTSRIARSGST